MEKIKKTLKDYPAMRWLVLLLSSLVMFMNYYFYDALSPLKDLMQQNLGFTSADYGIFVSAYSVPNIFLLMAVLGGIILDKIGIRITGTLFISLMAVGAAVTGYGASEAYISGGPLYEFMGSFWPRYSPELKMMYLGFFIFGLGAETSIVALSKVIVKWFKGKEIALALGLNLAIGRLGTALALNLSPILAEPNSQWVNAIWFGVILLWVGLLIFLVYILMDIKLDRQIKETLPKDAEDDFKWQDLLDLVTNRTFIYITLLCVTFYSAVFPFVKYAPDLLMNKYGLERQIAGNISSILMYGTILLTPLFGWIADYKGKSATLMYLGSSLLIIAHLMFAVTMIEPYIPIFLLGVAFSLVPAAMWPAVTKIVGENKIGTAYGAMFSVQNLGLWGIPILIGVVLDASNPEYRNEITNSQFASLQKNQVYEQIAKSPSGELLKNEEFKVKYIIHADSCKGDIIWSSEYKVKTNEDAKYQISLPNYEYIKIIDFKHLNLKGLDLGITIQDVDDDTVTLIRKEPLEGPFGENSIDYKKVIKDDGEEYKDETFSILITLFNRDTDEVVYKEEKAIFTDDNGAFEVQIGTGTVAKVNYNYIKFNEGTYCAEMIEPLDYTNAMFMFSFLGVLGIVFAFLLKRDDKVSGYGLEQPNKQKE